MLYYTFDGPTNDESPTLTVNTGVPQSSFQGYTYNNIACLVILKC